MPQPEILPRGARVGPPAPSTAEAIVAEHRALEATTRALARALQPAAEDVAWRFRLVGRLSDLQQQLEGHFGAEERSGLYEDIEAAAPQHAGAARRLRREHDELRARVRQLLGEAGAAPLGELRVLAERVRALLRDLEHHEARENELLVSTLDDGGTGVGD